LRQNEEVTDATVPCQVDPRIERTRRVVLDTTIQLIAECGYGAVTIEAVAARSGVAKSTIYRHWPNRLELINDAFAELEPALTVPPDGDIRQRVVALLEQVARNATASPQSACLTALIDAAEHDPEAHELRRRLSRAGRQTLVDLLDEGRRSGELPTELDPELVSEALAGPIFLRRLMMDEALDPADIRRLVDQVLGPRA
jgi:AcrR family transcriptional regulator